MKDEPRADDSTTELASTNDNRSERAASRKARRSAVRHGWATRSLVMFAFVAAAHWGKDVLMPLAVAGVIAIVLTPIVNRLERWRLPNGVAVIGVALVVFVLIGVLGAAVTNQASSLLAALPEYRDNIHARVTSVMHVDAGAIGKAKDIVEDIQREIREETEPKSTEGKGLLTNRELWSSEVGTETSLKSDTPIDRIVNRLDGVLRGDGAPMPVEVIEAPATPVEVASTLIGPLLGPAASFGIVIVFVIFFLLSRRDLKDRFLYLAGRGHLQMTASAIDEAGARISRYLLTHVCLNIAYGVAVGLLLWQIGLPGAVLWGLLAGLLRFVPYVGPWTSVILPVLLSLAVFEGWSQPLAIVGTFILLELLSNNLLEPWLYGTSTGISTIAVLLAALFWGWLWGPVGIVLAVPMTVVIVVLGRYVPQLAGFTILFGDESSLAPGIRFYHRVLARDEAGALQLARNARAHGGLIALGDNLVVPANAEEKRDRLRGTLAAERSDSYWEIVEGIVHESETGAGSPARAAEPAPADEGGADTARGDGVLCIPVEPDTEELNARLLSAALRERGIAAQMVTRRAVVSREWQPIGSVVLTCSPFDHLELRRAVIAAVRTGGARGTHVHVAGKQPSGQLLDALKRLGVSTVTAKFEDLARLLKAPDPEPESASPASVQPAIA